MPQVHCDEYIHDPNFPLCLRYWLLVNRLDAVAGLLITDYKGVPECYATWKGRRVRLVMASRLGDVGITTKLHHENGYEKRVCLGDLSDFGDKP